MYARRSKSVRRRVPRKKLPVKQKKAVTKLVKTIIARNLENKTCGFALETNVSHNSAIGPADCVPIVGQIMPIDNLLADTSTQRQGDRITPKSLVVRGVLSQRSTPLNQPLYVRVMIVAQKNIKTGSAITGGGVDTGNLLNPCFQVVGGKSAPYTGATVELNYPINTELFKVYMDRIIKIAPHRFDASEEEGPATCARWMYRFKSLPAALTYDDGNGNWANNFAPFLAIGYSYADGTAPDVVSQQIQSNSFSQLEFEDA